MPAGIACFSALDLLTDAYVCGFIYHSYDKPFKWGDRSKGCKQKKHVKRGDHEGTRTPNLPIRSRTPYPLGHAAAHSDYPATLL